MRQLFTDEQIVAVKMRLAKLSQTADALLIRHVINELFDAGHQIALTLANDQIDDEAVLLGAKA